MSDFVPAVDDGTIQRLIDRDYVDGVSGRVRTLLESYGGKPHHIERNRVRAAVLRLANGDLAEVQRQIAVANVDFRDVIGAAISLMHEKPAMPISRFKMGDQP